MSTLGSSFTINEVVLDTSTKRTPVYNVFDAFGDLLDLERLEGETNTSYRNRLFDVIRHRGGANYLGMVYSLTRELGLQLSAPISFSPGPDHTGEHVITVDEGTLSLWSDRAQANLVASFKLDKLEDNNYLLDNLVDSINGLPPGSQHITAATTAGTERSSGILNQSTIVSTRKTLESSKHHALGPLVVQGSFIIEPNGALQKEQPALGNVTAPGDYHIDYDTGILTTFNVVRTEETVHYRRNIPEFVFVHSPVVLRGIPDEGAQAMLFELDNQGSLSYLNDFGAAVIEELFSVADVYWGE